MSNSGVIYNDNDRSLEIHMNQANQLNDNQPWLEGSEKLKPRSRPHSLALERLIYKTEHAAMCNVNEAKFRRKGKLDVHL